MSSIAFPPDAENQTYARVFPINTGSLWLTDRQMFADSEDSKDTTAGCEVPVFVFLVDNPTLGKALFDLGLRKEIKGYPPALNERIGTFGPTCKKDVVDLLGQHGVLPSDIKHVVYSHLHWDHVGDPAPFLHAQFVLGSDSKKKLQDAYPSSPDSPTQSLPADMQTEFVDFASKGSGIVSPFGPFDHAFDLFGDGSFYVVQAPGHMAGHVAGCARVGPNSFVVLGGDCCHNRQCFDPGHRLQSRIMYEDVDVARDTVSRLKNVHADPKGMVILAHEHERLNDMPMFPDSMNEWAISNMS